MDKKLLKKLQARHEQRLTELRGRIESGEVREADLGAVQDEITGLVEELEDIKAELDGEDDSEASTDPDNGEDRSADPDESADSSEPESAANPDQNENRAGMISQQQRDGLLGSISYGLESRARLTKAQREK